MSLFSAAAQRPPATQPARPSLKSEKPASSRIAGKVVSAVDGHTLQQVTVRITEVRTGRLVATMGTGETGEFAFEDLHPDKYSLIGEAHGYLGAAYDEHEQFSTAIVTGVGLDTESLILRLVPAATLTGRILDENGEPVRGARVMLYREMHGTGKTQVGQTNASQSNDLGEYALAPLAEGNYYMAANAVPWYAMHPLGSANGMESLIVTGVDSALDVAYPVTFYPGVTESDAATSIPVKGGDKLNINLHLKPLHAVRLTVHMAPGEQMAYPQLQVPVFGGFEQVAGQINQSQAASPSTLEIVGLPPGHYQITQTNPQNGAARKTRMIDLVNASTDTETEGGQETSAIKVTLEDDSGGKLPANMQILIRGTGPTYAQGMITNEKSEAEFAGLLPDTYHFEVFGEGRAYRVLQVKMAGKNLPNDELRVSGGETNVTVVTTGTIVSVEGVAKRDGKPAAGAMVLLVPVDAMESPNLFRRDQSDLDGTFSLQNVSAGRYIVLAISEGWKLDWAKTEVLAHYLAKGVPLEVPVSARRSLQLSDPVIVQNR